MKLVKTGIGRRTFIRNVSLAGGGLVLGFSFLNSCKTDPEHLPLNAELPDAWFEMNGYLKIGDNGMVTILSPNPEGGQNVKTSMPMIVADELDTDWSKVIVEQAPLNTDAFSFQFIGGSQAIRRGWSGLRLAGASARYMIKQAAAAQWQVPVEEVSTHAGVLHHKGSNRSLGYGEVAATASTLKVPEEVTLKDPEDFQIIGTSRKNVDGHQLVMGKPLFGADIQREGMLIAMIVHPPAFGLKIWSVDDSAARQMPGIRDIFTIEVFNEDYRKTFLDTRTFNEVAVIVGETTWEVMQAKKALKITCEPV